MNKRAENASDSMLDRIADGRTDLVSDYVASGHSANSVDANGVSLIKWCAYYGDVSAIKFLLGQGERLQSLGENFGLGGAAFHGHWRLCQFLLERGADANFASENGETPLHSAVSKAESLAQHHVVAVLLANGANPNAVTKPGIETECFMRDVRTVGETPLHRAAAYASEATIQLLLEAGAILNVKDMNGDSPLTWASWHLRPDAILRKLCYGNHSIRPGRLSMSDYLLGKPHA
ncbi:MAG: ankyrin repeat domain-containing protein [Deltaproteobacteria bacterium]